MFCSSCKAENVDSLFATGTNNFKLEAVRQHETSKIHPKFMQKFGCLNNSKPEAAKCLMKLKENEHDSCHYSAHVEMVNLCNLCDMFS